MRQQLTLLTILLTLLGCSEQRGKIEKFVFDNKQITSKDIHRYKLSDDGKVKTDYRVSYMYMAGALLDSTISETHYIYNSKGQLISAVDMPDSTRQIKNYNELDSLVADYSINTTGDTTRLFTIEYENDRIKRRIHRILSMKIPDNLSKIKKEDFRTYDTLYFITDLEYEGDTHTKSLSRDKDGTITEEIVHSYEGDKLIKTITYSLLGDAKYIKQTMLFSSNETNDMDYISLGTRGDTIAFKKTLFQGDTKIVINHFGESNMQDISYYNNKRQLIGTVLIDLSQNVKTIYSYKYDERGNIIEEANYRERVNNAR